MLRDIVLVLVLVFVVTVLVCVLVLATRALETSLLLADWLIVWSDDISPRDVIGRSTADGGKRQRNYYIDRPDTDTSPNRPSSEPVYEATDDQTIYEETDIDARNYE